MTAFGYLPIKQAEFSFPSPCGAWEPVFSRFLYPQPGFLPPFDGFGADSALHTRQSPAEQRRHLGQVVGRKGEGRLGLDLGQANKARLVQSAHGLAPAKDLLDPLANLQAGFVTRVARGPAIDGAALGLLRHMGRDPGLTHHLDKLRHSVAFVRTQGGTGLLDCACHHGLGRFPFRRARGMGGLHIHHQPMAVLHQGMTHEAKPGFVALALLVQAGIRVGGRFMGLVRSLLALEDRGRIAPAVFGWRGGAILLHQALHGGPSLDQGAVHREVLVREHVLPLGQGQDLGEKGTGDLLVEQPIPVGAEGGVIPDRIVHGKADEAAVKQVEVDMLNQLPLRADREQGLDQAGAQETFGWGRSGGIEWRPVEAYSSSSSSCIIARMASTTKRSLRSGCWAGIRSSRVR